MKSAFARRGVPRQFLASSRARPWWRIENAAGSDSADIYIFDEISWFGITAQDFINELRAVDAKEITLHLNSPGGDVFDGIAIYQALLAHPAKVTTRVEGIAASIASVIAMAGDQVVMAKHSTMMIHDPWGLTVGTAEDHQKQADVLDQLGDEIASIYAEKADTGTRHDQQVAKWRAVMKKETWYTDQGAVDAGLADSVDDVKATKPKNTFDLSVFRNTPSHLLDEQDEDEAHEPTKREAERALRDAGLSHSQAKAVIAAGWPSADEPQPRDAAEDAALLALRDSLAAAVK